MRKMTLSFAVTAVSATAMLAVVGLPVAMASAPRATLPGTAVAGSVAATPTGAVSATNQVSFDLVLKLRDQAGAQALVSAVSTPGNASFHQYLTASQWESEFSPTTAQVTQAEAWLKSQGFTVGTVPADRLTIPASGTVAQVESAFNTTLETYQVGGRPEQLATPSLSVPSSVSGVVAGAVGVDQYLATPADQGDPDIPGSSTTSAPAATASGVFPPAPAAFLTHPPCGTSYGSSSTTLSPPFGNGYPSTVPDIVCGYLPGQLRSGYGLTSSNTGAGVTVAVIDAYGSSTINSDATRYFSEEAPSEPFSTADFTQIDQTPFNDESECAASGWATEQAIDIESVHSMAPDAHILYVGARNCTDSGLLHAMTTVIDGHLADVVTDSWGDDGGDLLDDTATKTAYDDLFMLADSTGITVQFSSGDEGDNFELLGVSTPDYPPSSPYVTAVGGTSLQVGPTGQRTGEVGWYTGRSVLCTANLVGFTAGCTAAAVGTWLPVSFDGGSGGYTSYTYAQPFYQAGVVPTALAERNSPILGPTPARVVPDISLDADPGTGFLIGLHQTRPNGASVYSTTRYGGTSLASPILAGIVADADQASGTPLGFLNPDLYKMDVADPTSIYDILPAGNQANFREDYAGPLGLGLTNSSGASATGVAKSFRELYFPGPEVYCDGTGNCATRPDTQQAATGYDSLTGLGSPGTNFIATLAGF
jgi:subtilase family serine protease